MLDFLKNLFRKHLPPDATNPPSDGEERFRLLVEGVRDYAIFLLDPQGRITSWNCGAERIKGYTAAEILGQDFSLFFPPEDVQAGKPARELEQAAAVGKYEEEGWRLRKDGSRFWASVLITALRDQTGKLRGFSKVTRDMTERKLAEEKLRQSHAELEKRVQERTASLQDYANKLQEQREWLRVTLASIGDAVIATDTAGRVTFLNPVAESLTGWNQEEAHGQPLDVVFPILAEQTGQPIENPVARVLREGIIVGLGNHTVLVARNGARRPIDDSAAPIRGVSGEIVGVVLTFRDVTEQRRAEQALRNSEQRFARFMHHLPGLAWIKDLQGRYVYVNEAAGKAFRIPRTELYGKTDAEVFSAETAAPFQENDRRALASGTGIQVVELLRHEDQHLHHSLVSKFPILGPDGKPAFIGGMAIDITDRLRTEEALKEADRRKDEFLAMLAHELRNPLAPMRNALHLMRMPGASRETIEEARQMTERQVQHLIRLVDDLLDVSRIMRGRIELRKEPVELATVIARSAEAAQPIFDTQGQQLLVSLPPERVWLNADPTRLIQVFGNLLHNAAKFSHRAGRVWLQAERQGEQVVVWIKDEGVGIAPDLLPQIFDLFVQGDKSLERSQGGLGIGLTVVRKLIELHGGQITAHSAGPGRGSEFVVRLPAGKGTAKQEVGEPQGQAASPPASRRVLVVDDNTDAAESIAMLLRLWGHRVRVAYTGPEALRAAEEYQPDVAFLDIGLPGMDGYEVARRLRQQPTFQRTVLAAVTGYGQEDDRRRSAEAGFNHHLTKPVAPETLQKILAEAEPSVQ
ncbi:MAG TPA: PAS domain S-box protein [Gemmataceae bacterium]|nr:PAS domain S-box protein [Gemmataceae bacterium]